MKATGIVRRIDELGRIVIPKEIRRTLRIREGDPLEIYTDREGGVILKKYSPIGELTALAEDFAEVLSTNLGVTCLICDRDSIIAANGKYRREYVDRAISNELEEFMNSLSGSSTGVIRLTSGEDVSQTTSQHVVTIMADGQPIGAVALISRGEGDINDAARQTAATTAAFLGKQMQ